MSVTRICCKRCGRPVCYCGCETVTVLAEETPTIHILRATPRGLPAYTPTEPQPTRCGGTEA